MRDSHIFVVLCIFIVCCIYSHSISTSFSTISEEKGKCVSSSCVFCDEIMRREHS